jgi:hypothetical protein
LSTASIAPEALRFIFWAIATRGDRCKEAVMDWARMLTYVAGTVDQELLARNEYPATENPYGQNIDPRLSTLWAPARQGVGRCNIKYGVIADFWRGSTADRKTLQKPRRSQGKVGVTFPGRKAPSSCLACRTRFKSAATFGSSIVRIESATSAESSFRQSKIAVCARRA